MSVATCLGASALAIAFGGHVELLDRLRRAEPAKPWWFGYARDCTNLAATFMLWGAYLMLGFVSPVALLAALLSGLCVYLLDWVLARGLHMRRPRLLLAVPLLTWVVAAALCPEQLAASFARLLVLGKP